MAGSKNCIFLIASLVIAEVYCSSSTADCLSGEANCTNNLSHGNVLIFTTPTKIKMLNLTTNQLSTIKTAVECATITAANDFVYYTNYRDNSRYLYKTSITSKMTYDVLFWNTPITSVAIDYITNNIYFSTETSILVCNSEDKKSCTHVVCYDAQYVALAPRSGKMFYTRKTPRGNRRYILKSNMDGSEEDIVIDGTFTDPFLLTVDESTETLYWVERGTNKIHSIPYHQNNARMTSRKIEENELIESMTLFKNKILLSTNQSYIIDAWENSQKNMFYPDVSTLSIELLHSYNSLEEKIHKINNPCKIQRCPSIDTCLLKPSNTTEKVEFSCLNQVLLTTCT